MARLFFDVLADGRNVVEPLPAQGTVLIGNGPEVGLRISGEGVEAAHARFEVESRTLEALAAGVVLDGEPVPAGERRTFSPGMHAELGSVSLHLLEWRVGVTRRLSSYAYFEQRIVEECTLSGRRQTAFSLLNVRLNPSSLAVDVEGALSSAIRTSDVLVAFSPGVYQMLLFDTDAAGGSLVSGRIDRLFKYLGISGAIGLATFPLDGIDADALAEKASQRALTADGVPPDADTGRLPTLGAEYSLDRVSRSELSVLILGESGSGKEVMAKRIHQLSPRSEKAFVTLNCAAFTESLLESELFGHEKGSFTGAVSAKLGLLETAEGGTIFLDEIGEMPLSMQAKLLRVLEDRTMMRVGGLKQIHIDVRFIAATNRDLEAESARGKFRADLYFRLDGATVIVPPLRERLGELESIATELIANACRRVNRIPVPTLSIDAINMLRAYHWPGNVRELRNMLERALAMADGPLISRRHLPVDKLTGRFLGGQRPPTPAVEASPALPVSAPRESWAQPTTSPATAPQSAAESMPPPHSSAPRRGWGSLAPPDQLEAIQRSERARIEQVLLDCGGNQSEAARVLGISRPTLIKRIVAFGLKRPRKKSESP